MIIPLVVSLVICVVSCGSGQSTESSAARKKHAPVVESHAEPAVTAERPVGIDTYLEIFRVEAASRRIDIQDPDTLVYQYADLPGNRVGLCTPRMGLVQIDRKYWEKLSTETKKEELVFHELGHCLLGRIEHTDTQINRVPTSIMSTSMGISDGTYQANRDIYIDELFSTVHTSTGLVHTRLGENSEDE